METIFMNTENSKSNKPHKFVLKKQYKNNKPKIIQLQKPNFLVAYKN